MTTWNELSESKKVLVEADLAEDLEIFQAVVDGYYCAICYMSYYNCLCSHDD